MCRTIPVIQIMWDPLHEMTLNAVFQTHWESRIFNTRYQSTTDNGSLGKNHGSAKIHCGNNLKKKQCGNSRYHRDQGMCFWMPKMPLFPTRSIQSVLTWNFVPLSTSTHAGEAVWPIMRSIDLIRFTFRSLFRPAGCEPCLAVWGRVDVVACQQFIGIGKGINFPIGGSIFLIYFFGLTEKDFCWLIGLVKRFKRLVIPTSPCNVYDGGILIRQNKFISELTDPHWHFGHWFSYLFSVSHWLFE